MKQSVPLMLLVVVASCLLAGAAPPPLPYNGLEEFREFVRQVKEKIIVERSYQIETSEELILGPGQAAHLNFAENPAGVAEFLFFYDASAVHIIYRCTDDPEDEYNSTSLHAERGNDFRSILATEAQTCLKCFTEWEPKDGKALVRFRTELLSEAEQKAFLKQRQEHREFEKHLKAIREQARAVREWDFAEEVELFEMVMDAPNDPNMIELRAKYGLEGLVRSAADEYERLRLILAWVQKQWQHDGSNAASKNDPLTILKEVSEGKRFRCVEFAYVMAGCARSLGMPARVLGLKRPDVETAASGAGHVVAEVWLRQFGKWVFVDGQWGAIPERDGVPLNGVEFQDAIARQKSGLRIRFVAPGDEEEYIEWIIPYLYYLDFRPDHRFYPKSDRRDAPSGRMIMLIPKGAGKPKVFQRNRPIENCTYISNPRAFYPQMNDDRPPTRKDRSAGDEPRQTTTRAYEFNTDIKFTLDKGSEVHLDCPDNPHGITEYVIYYHVVGSGKEVIGVRAVFEDGKRTEWNTPPGSCEAILQQAMSTPCLALLTWQPCDGGLDVSFRASDDQERNFRTYRQYVLSGKRFDRQISRLNLIFPDFISREQASADLVFLAQQLKARHPKPFRRISEEEFHDEVERLEAGLGEPVPIRKFSLAVAALLARVGDDHTRHRDFSAFYEHINNGGKLLPVKFRYRDGRMTIEAWSPEVVPVRMKAGDTVATLNGETMESLLKRYGRYISVETDLQRCCALEWAFDRYQVMLGEASDEYVLELRDAAGSTYSETLPAVKPWLQQYEASKPRAPRFSHQFYEDGKVCLFRLQTFDWSLRDELESTLMALLDAMQKKGTRIVILDLRGNSGGNATMGHMVLARMVDKKYGDIAPDPEHSWPVKIAVLCDRGTYSAGSFEAMRVKDHGIGIIAGEETGGRASFFGDIEHVTLPNSLLSCGIATGYFPRRAGYDDGRGVLPDVPLDVTLDDSILVEKICAYIRRTGEVENASRQAAATEDYAFNRDIRLTLEKNSEVHFTCPPNRHSIAEYVLYYRAPEDGQEIAGIKAVFTDNMRTECGVLQGSWEGILQQAGYTACLGIVKWQLHDGRLDVDFCATDDLERCRREYRQFRLVGKRYMTQYQDRQLVCPVELPEVQRLAGFARFWSEVKFNFPFFDKVPEVDWDQVLIDYLPQVQQAKTDVEYYRVLMRCVALLKDNHTSVWGATDEAPCRPPIEIRAVEGKAVIVRVYPADKITRAELKAELLAAGLKPGEEITHIDGRPVPQILAEDIYPYIAASTPQGLDLVAFSKLAKGENGTRVGLRVQDLQGEERDVSLTRGYYDLPKDKGPFLHELEGGIARVNLDSFGSDRVVKQFEEVLDKILPAQGLILDVRNNGGGNSTFGDSILQMLIDRPAQGCRWKTRQYLPAFRAWGRPEKWYEGTPGTLEPSQGRRYRGPVAVLTSPVTGSAAENFVMVFQASGRGKVVGQRTNGSTGQPLIMDLPGGGGFRVCTKRNSYPDGREFAGIGVIPDVEVNPTRQDIADGRDAVLEAALQVLRSQGS